MKLNETDLEVLRNFASINCGIVFENSDTITTMSEERMSHVTAKFSDTFPKKCALSDLNQFLNVLKILPDGELDFQDKFVRIFDPNKNQEVKFWYSPENVIKGYSGKWSKVVLPSEEIRFNITNDLLLDIQNAGQCLGQLPHICIIGKDGDLDIVVTDSKNPTSNSWRKTVGKTNYKCEFIFARNLWNFVPRTYDVALSKKGLARLTAEDIEYHIAINTNSTFEE